MALQDFTVREAAVLTEKINFLSNSCLVNKRDLISHTLERLVILGGEQEKLESVLKKVEEAEQERSESTLNNVEETIENDSNTALLDCDDDNDSDTLLIDMDNDDDDDSDTLLLDLDNEDDDDNFNPREEEVKIENEDIYIDTACEGEAYEDPDQDVDNDSPSQTNIDETSMEKCNGCGKFFKRGRGLKIHQTRSGCLKQLQLFKSEGDSQI